MRKAIIGFVLVGAFVGAIGCGGSGGAGGPGIGTGEPIISSLSPNNVKAGSGDTVVTVNGANYLSGVQVLFDGQARPTQEVNIRQLKVTLSAADLTTAGTYKVTVLNPNTQVSKAVNFTVNP